MIDKSRLKSLTKRADTLKALAHPSRLLIIEELVKKECCVNELTEMIGAEMPTISNHLKILRNAGYIDKEKRGTQVYYFLIRDCVKIVLECLDNACALK